MIIDFREGDLLHEELSELSSISSMVDIIPKNKPKTANIHVSKTYILFIF